MTLLRMGRHMIGHTRHHTFECVNSRSGRYGVGLCMNSHVLAGAKHTQLMRVGTRWQWRPLTHAALFIHSPVRTPTIPPVCATTATHRRVDRDVRHHIHDRHGRLLRGLGHRSCDVRGVDLVAQVARHRGERLQPRSQVVRRLGGAPWRGACRARVSTLAGSRPRAGGVPTRAASPGPGGPHQHHACGRPVGSVQQTPCWPTW